MPASLFAEIERDRLKRGVCSLSEAEALIRRAEDAWATLQELLRDG